MMYEKITHIWDKLTEEICLRFTVDLPHNHFMLKPLSPMMIEAIRVPDTDWAIYQHDPDTFTIAKYCEGFTESTIVSKTIDGDPRIITALLLECGDIINNYKRNSNG